MGTGVRELKKGYQIWFNYQGKRYFESIALKPCPANLIKVTAFRQEVIDAIQAGTFDYPYTFPNSKHADQFQPPPVISVAKYLRQWLDIQEKYLAASTYNDYSKIIENQLIPVFGDTPLNRLTRKQVKDWVNTLTCSTKRKGNIISPLRSAMDYAVDEDEILDENPLANYKIKRPKGEKRIDNIDPFSIEELNLIYPVLSDQVKNMTQFIAWSGVRTSEMVALNWDDVDFTRNKVRIDEAMTQAARKAEAPKTDAGYRWIDLLPPAREALVAQKIHTFIKGDEVFQDPRYQERWAGDQPIREKIWKPALKKAGVRYRYPYQLRHTFATMMLNGGESIRWISKQLGHVSWTFTARTYTRFMPKEFQNAGNKAVEKYWARADKCAD